MKLLDRLRGEPLDTGVDSDYDLSAGIGAAILLKGADLRLEHLEETMEPVENMSLGDILDQDYDKNGINGTERAIIGQVRDKAEQVIEEVKRYSAMKRHGAAEGLYFEDEALEDDLEYAENHGLL